MDRIFKSKVGWWYHLILLIMMISTVLTFIKGEPVGMVILLLITLQCIHMLLSTWYKITADGNLIVHCSIFPEKQIAISEISGVEVSSMPVSSYALSLDRLIIYKGDTQWLLISPVNKQEFIRLLRKYNPAIQIKDPMI
ncbi:MAG: PH domain-containing protein [Parabacteroides sp.]|nr:PH domain-containing protein [Parabacteroides sp.]